MMVRELFVIVHEEVVRGAMEPLFPELEPDHPLNLPLQPQREQARRVYEEIDKIKGSKEWLEADGELGELPSQIPPPSEELLVEVSGGVKEACVAAQLQTLTRAGYRAQIHEPSCFSLGF